MRNMIRSYFKTAWRNIIKHKVQSAINILSLSLGITCYLLISLWLSDEQGKDNFHEQQSKLYTTYITSTAALLTISIQVIQAASAKPVTSLREE